MALPDAQPGNFGGLAAFVRAAALRFHEERCLQLAGSLTYTTLLALVPLVTVALALVTAFPVFGAMTGRVDEWLAENVLPEQIANAITGYLGQFSQQAVGLTALGIAVLVVTALMMMLTIDRGLNQIFRVSQPRPLVQRLLIYWAVLTLGPVMIGASISMTSYLVSESLGLVGGLPILGEAILRGAPVVLTSAAMTFLYLVVPNRRVRISHALAGGLIAGIAFELMKRGFVLYVARFPTYTLVYGTFAALPIFLVWMYLSWLAVLIGAAATAIIPGYRRIERRGRPAGVQFYEALDILGALVRAQRRGQVLGLRRLAQSLRVAPEECERLLERMVRFGWVAHAAGEGWVLAREAGSLAVGDVYRTFVFDPQAGAERNAGVEEKGAVPLSRLFEDDKGLEEPERPRFELFSFRRERP